MSQNTDIFYSKYLKYKEKYLELKKSLIGGKSKMCTGHTRNVDGGYTTCNCTNYKKTDQNNARCKNCLHGPH